MNKCELIRQIPNSAQAAEEYQDDIDRRTIETVYEYAGVAPFDIEKHTMFGKNNPWSTAMALMRRAAWWMLPQVMEKAVNMDHPEVRESLIKHDQVECANKQDLAGK